MEEAAARQSAELTAADERRRAELQARDEGTTTRSPRWIAGTWTRRPRCPSANRAESDQTSARAARAEGELAARAQELGELSRRVLRVEGELDTMRADLRDREVKLAQARDRISEWKPSWLTSRTRSCAPTRNCAATTRIVDKAKRALAVALTLLDDRGCGGAFGSGRLTHAVARRGLDVGHGYGHSPSVGVACAR